MGKRLRYIIEYAHDKNIEDRIKKLGDVKYDLPLINSFVLDIDEAKAKDLHSVCNPALIHENTNITAQINTARKIVKADFVNPVRLLNTSFRFIV